MARRRVTHADRLQAHFYDLLDELGATVIYNHRDASLHGGGWARIVGWRSSPRHTEAQVCLAHRIRNTVEYFTGLHELGHVHEHKGARGFCFGWRLPILTSEWYAWRWALANACVKPTRATWADIAAALTKYAELYVNDKRVYQDPNFWALLAKARERS